MRKYPIGLQDFRKIREKGFLYIDKTSLIHNLIETGNYYFLSRPRRFGKSLLLSTIKEIFLGSRELFKDLNIENKWNWSQKHPVIHLQFSQMPYQQLGLEEAIKRSLDNIAEQFGFTLNADNIKEQFTQLIRKTSANGQVVILIDEYDKPMVDYVHDIQKAEENRAVIKSFYSVLKDADEYIRLLFLTGVSRFSKVSIFSDLNNLNDITLHSKYSTLTGITQQELESYFTTEIKELQQGNPAILEDIKHWYNGYSWDGKDRVYNPFSLLNFMADGNFRNYWFATGTPTWLVKLMRKNLQYDWESVRIGENTLSNFNMEKIDPIPVLFQTGYLTIKSYKAQSHLYELGYPNKEVKDSLIDNLLSMYREVQTGDSVAVTDDLSEALKENNVPFMMNALNALISTIPYDHWKAESESVFHIIVHLAFKRLGLQVQSEVHSSTGRCDILILTDRYIYALELKLDNSAQKALEQIEEKGYLKPYVSDERQKIAIGINFSSEKKEIIDYKIHVAG